jgi:DNA-binding transcriptional ArsR family regulator
MVKILKCSMFGEFVHLATRVANQTLTDTVHSSLVLKYPIKMQQAQQLLKDIAVLEERLIFMIDSMHPEFQFFFQNAEGQSMSLAQSMLILFENKDEIPTIDKNQWSLFFTFALSNFLSEDTLGGLEKGESLPKDELVSRLIRSDLPDTLKYRFMILLENPNGLLKHLFGMYEDIKEDWLKHQKYFDALIKADLQKYESMSDEDLVAFVEKTTSIRSIPKNQSIAIAPSVFNYNALYFSDSPWYQKDAPTMIWNTGIKLFEIFELINSASDQKQRLASALKVLGDQSKLEILMLCKQNPQYGVNLAKELKLTSPTVSYHLNTLVSLGYLSMNMEGNRIYYKTQKERIQADLRAISDLLD